MAKADACIVPSLWEGFCLVIVEALALGVPVIATDCPSGPREILQDGQYGVLVPVQDANGLADAINELLTDASQRARLTEAGKSRANRYLAGDAVEKYLRLMSQLGHWT
jgi:glycosyltransferase involved in cell wall biosynthesis